MATNYHYEGCFTNQQSEYPCSSGTHSNKNIKKMKTFDEVVFDLLKVAPETIAKQLTLLDFPIFRRIRPCEVSSCGWTKKDKRKISPNVDDMTKRFNHTSFWVIKEILNASTLKIRAEVITHFIKIAKKLMELNNLHSLMAVVKSLTSSSIYRLSQTWALVPRNHRHTFERLQSLVNEDDNRKTLRAHMSTIRLPCIPYLGMYLADVMYVNSAHPDTGGLESRDRTFKMNNILRVISEYQQSDYNNLEEATHILHYLNSVDYIEELQRFKETENYNKSLKIEPVLPPHTDGSQRKEELTKRGNFSTAKGHQKFVPGHRKSQSLGKDFMTTHNKMRAAERDARIQKRQSLGAKEKRSKHSWSPHHHNNNVKQQQKAATDVSESLPREATTSNNHYNNVSLLDDSILLPSSDVITTTSYSSNTNSECSNLHDDQLTCITSHRSWLILMRKLNKESKYRYKSARHKGLTVARKSQSYIMTSPRQKASDRNGLVTSSAQHHHEGVLLEGVLKRKCVLKRGRRHSLTAWKRFWARLSSGNLQLFPCKALASGSQRSHFKSSFCKQMRILNWMVIAPLGGNENFQTFQLSDPEKGTIYRFQTCSKYYTPSIWVKQFCVAVKPNNAPEKDLIDLNEEVR